MTLWSIANKGRMVEVNRRIDYTNVRINIIKKGYQ